ncbi:MAG: PmoA family protein [Cyclobacteriaceae bacterium]|nr:PmoA family protein [Cyclobacteriaceae bacterium]
MDKKFFFMLFLTILSAKINLLANVDPVSILILSGRNNHEWDKTTLLLEKIFNAHHRFQATYTYQPDTLTYNDLMVYDAIVSNFNSWPENEYRWPAELEQALLKYIEEGGGMVFFHAATSAFYGWPEFKNISTGAWIDETSHGRPAPAKVSIENQQHPITRGMKDFVIFDELWINAEQNSDFEVLAYAINEDAKSKGHPQQAAVMIKEYGKGRIFHTILGHDSRAMRNTGFQSLMLRGTEWAANNGVTIKIPQELSIGDSATQANYSWHQSDSSMALVKNNRIVWQFNYHDRFLKPYMHPVYVNDIRMTALSPDDHVWHLGQWFSWKYINGINFWEYSDRIDFTMEGSIEIRDVEFYKNPDHSARISYTSIYSSGRQGLLEEKTEIRIHSPEIEGHLVMDYDITCRALAKKVELNRTPPPTEGPEGKLWGGYAGLSIRFNQDFMNSKALASGGLIYEFSSFAHNWDPRADELKITRYKHTSPDKTGENWYYMGFDALDGRTAGSAVFIHPKNRGAGEAWYSVNSPGMPFFFFSPAYLYHQPVVLKKNDSIHLKYRVLHVEGMVDRDKLDDEYLKFISGQK